MEPLIEFSGVSKAFGPKVIYRDLNLLIERGDAFTILGGSGVGKSVMLKMLIGLLKPDAGHIYFDGDDVVTMTRNWRVCVSESPCCFKVARCSIR